MNDYRVSNRLALSLKFSIPTAL